MRFSRIAMIFQSASICTTSLAAIRVRHTNENAKVFRCDYFEIAQDEYSRVQHVELTDSLLNSQTLTNLVYGLVENILDRRNVIFHDQEYGYYQFFDLESKWTRTQTEEGTIDTHHILVNDQHARACAMMMRKSLYSRGNLMNEPVISYSLCEARS
ncbi:putative candidate secreted effector protein [Blumeria hordei DH14]|uniref:Putative candidate secreted effector protein n=1 Tax=Blumeria graminis f. sp. hordei (strain DH14) TaxID=546991 RepID=N1JPH3_BLUG1|nr:putative candidate secreted effector protein [Blumeria hordei DH14]